MAERVAIYPGTFDPVTNGHLDIITRAVAAGGSPGDRRCAQYRQRPALPALDERVALVAEECAAVADRTGTPIDVTSFDTLLIEFARASKARIIIRGPACGLRISTTNSRWPA